MNRISNWCFGSMPAAGFGGSLLAAMDRNAFMAWTAAGVGAAGLVVQGILSWYRQARDLKRAEDDADRFNAIENLRLIGKAQLELEHRITRADLAIVELAQRIESVRCVFPNPDGSPRCRGQEKPSC
jgi:hypothetical protein